MVGFNEGKACDAVIRLIEMREASSRHGIRFPERENHLAAVELVCFIGEKLFAFEHTSIEPFERLTELEAKEKRHFQPIRDTLKGRLPPSAILSMRGLSSQPPAAASIFATRASRDTSTTCAPLRLAAPLDTSRSVRSARSSQKSKPSLRA